MGTGMGIGGGRGYRRLAVAVSALGLVAAATQIETASATDQTGVTTDRLIHAQAADPGGDHALAPVAQRGARLHRLQREVTEQTRRDTWSDGVVRRAVTIRAADLEPGYDGGNDGRRFAQVVLTQDLAAQRLVVTATLRAAPTQDTVIVASFGIWNGDTCQRSAAVLGTTVSNSAAGLWGSTEVAASRSRSGNTIRLATAVLPAVRGVEFDCAFVRLNNLADASTVYQSSYGESLIEEFRPQLRIDTDEPSMLGARAGAWISVDLEVDNPGNSPVSGVVVRASGKKLQIKRPTRALGTIADRDDTDVRFKVRLKVPKKTAGARKRSKRVKPQKLTVRASAAGVSASRTFTVVVSPKPTRPKSLVGRYFWAFEPSSIGDSSGWRNHTVWFVNRKFAFIGDPGTRKPKCRKASRTCVRYSWNPRRGVGRLGSKKIKVTSAGFSWQPKGRSKMFWTPLSLPKKGSRVGLDLYRQDWSGYCLISCTTWTDYLTMDRQGRFITSGSSIGSWPGLGSYWSTVSADSRGRYRFVGRGIVELAYANGKKERRIFGVEADPRGKANPEFGVLMGLANYY